MKLYNEKSEIHAAIKAFGETHRNQRDEMHSILVSITLHIAKHGDVTNMQTLVNEDLTGLKKDGITKWCQEFMAVEFQRLPGKTEVTVKYDHSRVAKIDYDKARSVKWYTLVPDKDIGHTYDLEDDLRAVLATAVKENVKKSKLLADGKNDEAAKINVDFSLINQIKALLKSAKAEPIKNDDVPQSNLG